MRNANASSANSLSTIPYGPFLSRRYGLIRVIRADSEQAVRGPAERNRSAVLGICLCLMAALSAASAQADSAGKAAGVAAAPRPHEAVPSIRAARRTTPVRIDGRLDDPAWRSALPFSDFRQLDPREGAPASERTEARVLIDDDALYVGVHAFDREPDKIQRQLARRDDFVEGDIIEVFLDSFHDHLTAFGFRLSAGNAKRDATLSPDDQDNSWDAVWDGAASVDSTGWSAEFRIPLSQLRYDPSTGEPVWGIQIDRRISRKGETIFLSLIPKSEHAGVNGFGHLTGLSRLPAPRRVELIPYALAKNENPTAARDDPFRQRNAIGPGAGVDVKYGISSNFTLDATLNPDFGQVEVDPAVVNLSAFETFFPERRPFFIEGANIFGFGSMRSQNRSNGYTMLHTRRIGRAPQRFIDGAGISFVDAPLETTIAGAAKLTGRTRAGWSVGLLDAVTTRESARFRTATSLDTSAIVEPLSNYFAGRLKRDLRGGNTSLGVEVTAVHRDLSEPVLDTLYRKAAYVAGFDWNHAWHNRRWAFDGSFVTTYNGGSPSSIDALQLSSARYFQRPDKRSFRRDPSRTSLLGYMGEWTVAKLAGEHWRGSLTYQEYNPGFDLNETGFLGRTDMRSFAPIIAYVENTPSKLLRNWNQYLFWNPSWNFDGDLTFNGVGSITVFETPSFWDVFLRLDWRPPVIDDRLTRGGPLAGLTTGKGVLFQIDSDRRKRYTYGSFVSYSNNAAGGWGTFIGPYVSVRPSTAMRVQFQPNFSRTHALAQFVTRVADANAAATYGTRYVFSTLDQRELSMTTRLDWTFTPNVSVQLFAQPLLSAGDFLDFKEFARPREFKFRVYGRDAGTISRDNAGVYTVDPDGPGTSPAFTFSDPDFNGRFLRGNAVLRWEYRPGSAIFLVWQQSRSGSIGSGEFDFGRDFDSLWGAPPVNVFVIKATWRIGR